MKVSSKSQINPSRPNPRQIMKTNLYFLFSHFFVVPIKTFMKAFKTFRKPFKAPQRSVKLKFKSIFILIKLCEMHGAGRLTYAIHRELVKIPTRIFP